MHTKDDSNKQNPVELAKEFAKATENVKATAAELTGRIEKGEKLSQDAKEKADDALNKYNELSQLVQDLNQKANRRGGEGETHKTLGEKFAESEEFKSFAQNPRAGTSAKLNVKEIITSATTDTAGSAGALIPKDNRGLIDPTQQRLTVRDLLMPGTTNSNAITYMVETGFTNAAAAQAKEGDLKPESDLKFTEKTVNVKTLAHWAKTSRQILDDVPMLASYIENRLMYGLKLVEEKQLLNGDGTAGNLLGIIPQATAFANKAPKVTNPTMIDTLRLAMLQAILAEYPASGHVLNPIDWATIELAKDGENRYIIGQPQGETSPTLWRLPVVETQSMGAGNFLTGAFNLAAQLFDRQQAGVAISTENQDDFVRNLVTILVEERLALAVYRPEAFIYGTFA